ncbi:EsaB/YukD family protein [Actinoallomurus sp. NBC_01490]|uniref:EsaB/YukD family protein n=1 Tax=Actinoallomurus sp. NBC_01490 TaxID=2903557 RepID=UPI002E318941|nr:EsaB/YukD family protein [Actinoallomurus sp. NBC_01490]
MASWSRVTIVGDQRRVDAVLPAQEPIGALMPDVLQLLGDQVEHPPRLRHLVTTTGEVLDGNATLADLRVPDASVLRLIKADEPLPPPVVHEVPEMVGDALDGHNWRWGPGARRWTATLSAVALSLAIGAIVEHRMPEAKGLAVVAVAAALILVAGTAVGVTGREPLGTGLTLSGGSLAGLAIWFAADVYAWDGSIRLGGLTVLMSLVVIVLGLTSPLHRGGTIGGGVALVLAMAGTISAGLGLDGARVGAVLAIVSVVMLSLLLRISLMLSGLTALDDRRSQGGTVARTDVTTALVGAHRSMVVAAVAVAIAVGVAGYGPIAAFDGWTAGLSLLLATVVASRARAFPLAIEKIALFGAALWALVCLALAWADHDSWAVAPAIGILLMALVPPIVALSAEPPEHVRARLRRIVNRIETVAVVVMVPVALGAFGTFERLLNTW